MSGVLLVLMGLTMSDGGGQGADRLIVQLGAPRYADRESAAAALEALGRSALPALLASRQHPDLEIRSRVSGLVVKIEGALLLEPTPIPLDFHDRPIEEVVREVGRRGGVRLVYNAAGPARSVTLLAERPVPFWEAIDRLCEAGGLGYSLAAPNGPASNERAVVLSAGSDGMGGRRSDHGPFRVNLIGLHHERNLLFGVPTPSAAPFAKDRPPMPAQPATVGGPMATEQFVVRLQAATEPHLSVRQTGPLRLIAAVDDLGRSLVPPATPGPQSLATGNAGASPNPLQYAIGLRPPDRPARTMRVLRGSIPVSVASRRPDPLVVPLEGAVGKTFRNGDATVTIHEARPTPNPNQLSIELSIVADPSRAGAPEAADADLESMFRNDVGPLQLELADASGRPVSWFASSTIQNGEESRMTIITLPNASSQAAPVSLRYFGTVRASTEIPFEFRDVPLP